ncbi:hypothetical protein JKP88DRAFT_218390 [Tribonema minus]|uniref:Uncharacterized protein n=1 Tax=Tribonema minus TaxID=303371 RepID=A0A835ZCX3_9STRA|nr:hypothetical protein JKP88DRAFT_218390 [Tribonema minus]
MLRSQSLFVVLLGIASCLAFGPIVSPARSAAITVGSTGTVLSNDLSLAIEDAELWQANVARKGVAGQRGLRKVAAKVKAFDDHTVKPSSEGKYRKRSKQQQQRRKGGAQRIFEDLWDDEA